MGNRRHQYMTTLIEGTELTFSVVTMGLDYIRIEDPQAHRIPNEFVFKLTGTLGLSIGRIDWIDGNRIQIRIEQGGPIIADRGRKYFGPS